MSDPMAPTAQAATPPDASGGALPTLSILIPTKNRPADLLETLETIATQTRAPDEVVIVDQSAESIEARAVQAFAAVPSVRVKYVWAPEIAGLVAARNRSVEEASGDVVFFIDDDISLRRDCVKNLLERYWERPDIFGICGVDMAGGDVPWWLVLARRSYMLGPFRDKRSLVNKQHERLRDPIQVRLISGGLVSYRRLVFDEFAFEGRLWGHRWNSSNDFSYRVSGKYPLIIDPQVCVRHRKPYGDYTPEEFVRVRVSGTFFFFSRNIKKNLTGWLSFIWVLVAIFVRSVWRGLQAKALRVTLWTFFAEVGRGITFLRKPFEAPY